MTQVTRRELARADTDREIRRTARELLVRDGPRAVSLRAIARELGVTAPALYRYYSSHSDLLDQLRADVCADLGAELAQALPDADARSQVLAVCRAFRRWALAHPQEFVLVFATPAHESTSESFAGVFLGVVGRILIPGAVDTPRVREIPAAIRADLAAFLDSVGALGVSISVETGYAMLQFWGRLYGQVALEVFGQFPFPVRDAEPVFEAMLIDLVDEFGPL
ncbi:Transcriptional regulator, TetR family [Alloactinosynnema sp. L-07]|uniref:TetR/AcrR family transcriptional regulator n=1 Tax=Alloactinosynnema sp. L-07 TaxID=1653480 RepID=UPI00065EF05D|nr:TetR/AcrR family transcriptional regulator [Alloactinosynnema sp. L-07]CRK60685.1 Transcriptional regulator, TetR family [Alloactinosynnema sp. L-07]